MRRLFLCYFTGLMSLTLALAMAQPARAQSLITSEPQLAIADHGGEPACVDTITFTQTGDSIGAFRVGLAIVHGYQAQLRVLLLPPGVIWPSATYSATDIPTAVSGGAVELVANAGGSSVDIGFGQVQPYGYTNFTTAGDPVFDPGFAAMSIDGAADATGLGGTWLAHDASALQSLYGGDPANFGGQGGVWTLVVIDDAPTQDGTLVAWQLEYDVIAGDPPEILVLRGGPIPDNGADDLGILTAGLGENVTYNIGNTGLGALHVTGVSTAAAINCTVTVVTPVPFTVAPSDASPLELEVTPLSEGPFEFDLVLHNDDADENPYRIHVTGTATADATQTGTPDLVVAGQTTFMTVEVGSFSSAMWTVSNDGDADLIITGVDSIGAHASAFAVSGMPLPVTIPPGGNANLQVLFVPGEFRSHSAVIRFTSNHSGAPGTTTEVAVSGFVTGEVGPGDPGCQCRNDGGSTPGSGGLILLLVLGVLGWRRRRQTQDVS